MMRDHSDIKGIYASLEDFMEKAPSQTPPVLTCPAPEQQSPLRRFIALPQNVLLILGPRRHPPVPARVANTNTSIAIQTAVGFSTLEIKAYVEAAQILKPDIVFGIADFEFGKRPGVKRLEKMGDRSLDWVRAMATGIIEADAGRPRIALFAPVLPIEPQMQSHYLCSIEDELSESISGWAVHDASSIVAIPESMNHLPRLSLSAPESPHSLLDQVVIGMDICTIPFIGEATDAGVAFTFSFPIPNSNESSDETPIGLDLWSPAHVSDLSPILEGCSCYCCANHHRAYLHHLLNCKEMLVWVLLQIHNHHVCDLFFAGIRRTIGESRFNREVDLFKRFYQPAFPPKTGSGPRIRGYQTKSGVNEPRKNPIAFKALDDGKEKLAETTPPSDL
ncbi:MAG: hypothetical protein LQ342_002674 [Letrouitia transgressa]|nr:MAG: hypothetical protein LQ342_002674 [Letrouitia transgressa]